jgi:hypothetical protein
MPVQIHACDRRYVLIVTGEANAGADSCFGMVHFPLATLMTSVLGYRFPEFVDKQGFSFVGQPVFAEK